MLQTVDLACTRGDRPLFRGLAFTLNPGELLHIRGTNGSGKTTLLRTLCGLSLPEAGEVRWSGHPIRALAEDYREKLCYVGHSNGVQGDLTAVENLRFDRCLSSDAGGLSIGTTLDRLGLAAVAHLPAKLLSQGQKRRLALARLLVRNKRLWILDEPFTALDTRSSALMLELLAEHLARDGLIVLTSHQEVVLTRREVLSISLDN